MGGLIGLKIKISKVSDKYEITITCLKCKKIVYRDSNISPENLTIRTKVAEKQKYCFICNSQSLNSYIGFGGKLHRTAAIHAVERY